MGVGLTLFGSLFGSPCPELAYGVPGTRVAGADVGCGAFIINTQSIIYSLKFQVREMGGRCRFEIL